MKTLVLALFLYLSIFSTCTIYAGNENLTASYPASGGYYNKIVLQNLAKAPDCSNSNNAGILYMDPTLHSLEMCVSGSTSPVPYPENCFNRFCSWTDTNSTDATKVQWCQLNGCPRGYSWSLVQGPPSGASVDEDVITTSYDPGTGNYYHLQSALCCSTGSTVLNPPITY